jgi:hypothetical protein
MTTPPAKLRFRAVSEDEMKQLAGDLGVAQRLVCCTKLPVLQQQDENHERFCCKKYRVLYSDSNTGQEVAVAIEQVHADTAKGTTRTFTSLRIDNTVYRLRIP